MLWELSVTEQGYRAVLEVVAEVPVTEVADRYGDRFTFLLGGNDGQSLFSPPQ